MLGFKGLEELINIHPLFVHFPIALIFTSLVFYFLGSFLKKEELLIAGKWTLYFGAIAAALAVWTGLQAAGTVSHGGEVHELITVHQYFGYAILGLSVILSFWLLISKAFVPRKGRFLFLILLFVLAALIAQSADFGGRMVFQHGVGVGKKSMMQETMAHDHSKHDHGEHAH